ncbi:zinc ABC transporter substrate-binding protein [Photorhabdus namnaonensis]|nr:zinc ABC transporter substrate-binding protein [Photorhabdus namnaonensis]
MTYIKMLALPYIRNIQTHSKKVKGEDVSCYFEAELIHNLYHSILDENFQEHDIYFLNHQAKYYYENCNEIISPNYNQHLSCIKDLFAMIPDNLKEKLIWSGP